MNAYINSSNSRLMVAGGGGRGRWETRGVGGNEKIIKEKEKLGKGGNKTFIIWIIGMVS